MQIRNSKKIILFYAWLALAIILIISIKVLNEIPLSTNDILVFSGFFILILVFAIYLLLQANAKKLLYKITENEIINCGRNTAYQFSDLKYFRHEKIFSKISVDYIYFYDAHKNRICDIQPTFTDTSPEEVCSFLKGKLIKLETSKGFY